MKILPTRVHGVLDYLVALLMISMPWILGISNYTVPTTVLIVTGVLTIIYSAFTAYEAGIVPALNMKGHLTLDALSGIFLIVAPWILGFSELLITPFVALGFAELLIVLITRTVPEHIPHSDPVQP